MILEHIPLTEFYRKMTWPTIPDSICNDIIQHVEQNNPPNIREGETGNNRWFNHHTTIESFDEWYQQHLAFIPEDYTVRIQKISTEGIGIHTDYLRKSSYNFVLTYDGSTTHWHDSNNNILHSYHYEPRTWYQHQSQIPHSVVNSAGLLRIAITIYKFEFIEKDWTINYTGDRHDPVQVDNFIKTVRGYNEQRRT